jgi:hypothetical protein
MAETRPKASDGKKGKGVAAAAIGLLAAGTLAAAAAYAASRKQADNDDDWETDDAQPDVEIEESVAAVVTVPVEEPMQYTGTGTPDMAVSYTPGLDDSEDRLAGDESSAIGTAEQRDTMAGVRT